ncbi:hypothetical protein [Oryzicola mucosus]|nr:hypothetical protein [Oryzicola mucosus]
MNALCAAMNSQPARLKIRFVCLGLEMGDPFRTAGNEGVPL